MNKKISIGFLTPTVGIFGAIREVIEISNELIKLGHQVTIYHPDGLEIKWMPSFSITKKISFLQTDNLDILIGIIDWQPELYQNFENANAKIKAICLMGFNPTEEMAQALRGEKKPVDNAEKMLRDAITKKYLILADSGWQVEWVKNNVGYPAGPAFGGINLKQFFPKKDVRNKDKFCFIYSGDPRDRKGTDTVEKAIEIIKLGGYASIEFNSYWGKRFSQKELVEFIQEGDVFLDGHRRAGWCNPVAEAIACGTVPVATDIGANRDFAIHEQTALIVPVDDAEMMAKSAIRLMQDDVLRQDLADRGTRKITEFSYPLIAKKLEKALKAILKEVNIY